MISFWVPGSAAPVFFRVFSSSRSFLKDVSDQNLAWRGCHSRWRSPSSGSTLGVFVVLSVLLQLGLRRGPQTNHCFRRFSGWLKGEPKDNHTIWALYHLV